MNRTELFELFTEKTGKSLTQMKRYLSELGEKSPYSDNILEKLIELSEAKNNQQVWNKGISCSEETKQKIAESKKGSVPWNKGKTGVQVSWIKGKHHSEETKQKIRIARANQDMSFMKSSKYREAVSSAHVRALSSGKYHSSYIVDGIPFDSSWEVLFYLFHKEGGNKIERSVVLELDNGMHYICDFRINGKLYEIKGPQFFDKDGHLCIPFGGVKKTPKKEAAFDKYDITIITDIEPYKKWSDSYFCPDYEKLFAVNLPFPDDKPIYHCHKKGEKSPYDAFYDMELRQKAIENRLLWGMFGKNEEYNWTDGKFTPKHDRITSIDIVHAFSIAKIAPKVSELQENKVIIPENVKTLVNPFSGFGAVLRVCSKKGIKAVGYDIQNVCNEPNLIIQDLTDKEFIDTNEYDCLFCCPPYADKEEWTVEMPEIKTCDEWIDLCLKKFPNCKKYIFIVDKSDKYEYAGEIENKSHLTKSSEHYVIL